MDAASNGLRIDLSGLERFWGKGRRGELWNGMNDCEGTLPLVEPGWKFTFFFLLEECPVSDEGEVCGVFNTVAAFNVARGSVVPQGSLINSNVSSATCS